MSCAALGFENYEKNIEIYEKFESIAEGANLATIATASF